MSLLLTFYGDDFTGSSGVMEVLSFAGVPTMLFLKEPDPDTLTRYPDLKAVGIPGIARSKRPSWMRENLPRIFNGLTRLGAPFLHYKVCSTFDSAPEMGSIGTASEIGAAICGGDWIPLVVGAPELRRYQIFGQLFANAGDPVYRLDRHPIMSRHPATPMNEADLARHLSAQTDLKTGTITLEALKSGQSDAALARNLADGARIVAIDVLDDQTLVEAGRLIWQDGNGPDFVVGSQGVEYALVAHWRATGFLPDAAPPAGPAPVDQIFGVSGSCSDLTAKQIAHAERQGCHIIAFNAECALNAQRLTAELARVEAESLSELSNGRDVLVVTARGPDDPNVARLTRAIAASSTSAQDANDRLGQSLGQLVLAIRQKTNLPRIIVAGGDTSGHALTELDADALSAIAPLAPGAPLCRLHSATRPDIDGLQVTLKGGQMGAESFFIDAKGGAET